MTYEELLSDFPELIKEDQSFSYVSLLINISLPWKQKNIPSSEHYQLL